MPRPRAQWPRQQALLACVHHETDDQTDLMHPAYAMVMVVVCAIVWRGGVACATRPHGCAWVSVRMGERVHG